MKKLAQVSLTVLIVLCMGVVLSTVIWTVPRRVVDDDKGVASLSTADRLKAENDVRATLIQGLLGASVIAGLYFSARTLRLGTGSLKVSADTLALNQDAEFVDRFTKAIDQLGHSSSDVRMGAIYALERVARYSSVDHPTVMEILAAYLREHSKSAGKTRGELQAAATVIGRRKIDQDPPGWVLNLRAADLSGFDLRESALAGAILEGASLRGAQMDGANLTRARATGAWLEDARLVGAQLEGVDFTGAHLDRATLTGAHAEMAHFEQAHLDDAVLFGAKLGGAVFTRAHLIGTIFDDADLQDAVDLPPPHVSN